MKLRLAKKVGYSSRPHRLRTFERAERRLKQADRAERRWLANPLPTVSKLLYVLTVDSWSSLSKDALSRIKEAFESSLKSDAFWSKPLVLDDRVTVLPVTRTRQMALRSGAR